MNYIDCKYRIDMLPLLLSLIEIPTTLLTLHHRIRFKSSHGHYINSVVFMNNFKTTIISVNLGNLTRCRRVMTLV